MFIQKRHLAARVGILTSLHYGRARGHKIVAVLAETEIFNF
ncbi:MAG: hypothetical protein P8Y40_08205 [Desulfobacterales bacterium]